MQPYLKGNIDGRVGSKLSGFRSCSPLIKILLILE